MTKDEARALLDAYDNEVFELRASGFVSPHYLSTVQSVLDAMIKPAETIAEQQREIERLRIHLANSLAWIKNVEEHTRECQKNRLDQPLCTCGLGEVLK